MNKYIILTCSENNFIKLWCLPTAKLIVCTCLKFFVYVNITNITHAQFCILLNLSTAIRSTILFSFYWLL